MVAAILNPIPLRNELRWMLRAARAPRLRRLHEFAEEEIVLPTGPFKNRRFRLDRQPYVRLLYDEIESGRWRRFAIVGCVRSGKTVCGFVIPILYNHFEYGESTIAGIPSMELAWGKWSEDIRPVLEKTRYAGLIPSRGKGSRGGSFTAIRFRNGTTLRFMSGGGRDHKIASYDSRVVVVTEPDKMEDPGARSREADNISRLEARTFAYEAAERRFWLECTASIETGRIWREYTGGSESRIVVQCRACREWSTPERENLKGWQEAADEMAAGRAAYWECPHCRGHWTDADRRRMVRGAKLLHRGQSIDKKGRISGALPHTYTLGFRWNAFDNLFWSTVTLAEHEWRVAHDTTDPENAERECLQFWWARPYTPPALDAVRISEQGLAARIAAPPRGLVPAWADHVTVGIDLGKWLSHWLAIAWRADGRGHLIDYGRIEVPSDSMPLERAVYNALLRLKERLDAGWAWEGHDGLRLADEIWIDSRYAGAAVHSFCRQAGKQHKPCLGYGASQDRFRRYTAPKGVGKLVRAIGEQYHLAWSHQAKLLVVEVDADHWKTKLHESLAAPLEGPGALSIFRALPNEHLSLFKHWMAEEQRQEFSPELGRMIVRWIRRSTSNHWFDAGYLATAAAHLRGVRIVAAPPAPQPAAGRWFAEQDRKRKRD